MGSMVVYTSEKDQLYDAKLVRTENKPILLSTTGRVYPEKSGHAGPIKKTIRVRENCPMVVKTRAD